ncbi:hypothetical protein [Saccharospirillum salsuginis]|uniref:Uncharacterized protein n=1 Tax=Saccharospirillum salsuginis TaxID=418750 RepID=A0A918K141_9GAMM|nr:hypothetical protein [Saccharospirillum salsuginis]GGX41042.1 hypothetical protein GCM10007392_04820 [Saccharospirillum salsuginis]
MKSHDFAKNLVAMANILRSGPNVELENLNFSNLSKNSTENTNYLDEKELPKALSMMVELNQVSKNQWLSLISEYDFDVPTRPRDANRDIIGKLLKYLSENPDEREKLSGKKVIKKSNKSSELADALSLLLR